jgi:hypothetical protein
MVEFFGLVYVRIGKLESVYNHPDATEKMGDKMLFINAVAVPECIAVKKNVP